MIKRKFFQVVTVSLLLFESTILIYKNFGEKARRELHDDAACSLEQITQIIQDEQGIVGTAEATRNCGCVYNSMEKKTRREL